MTKKNTKESTKPSKKNHKIHESWHKPLGKNQNLFSRKVVAITLAFFILLAVLGGGFFGYEKVYAGKIYPGVTIGGVAVWGENQETAKTMLEQKIQKINDSEIDISANGQQEKIKLADLGLSFDSNNLVSQAYMIGREDDYRLRIPKVLATLVEENNIPITPSFDEEKIKQTLNKIAGGVVKEAKNATYKVENDKLTMVLSEEGSGINLEKFKSDLINLINNDFSSKNIELMFQKTPADISENEISSLQSQIEKIITPSVLLEYNYRKYEADKAEIASWVLLKKDNYNQISLSFNDEEIKSFIEYIAKKIDQKPVAKQTRSDNGQVVAEGRDGIALDQEKTLASIKEILLVRSSGKEITNKIDLIVKETPREEKQVNPEEINTSGGTPGLYDGRYLEIDLSNQKLYCWEGTSQACANTVSTGKWSMPTPTGTRYIDGKSDRAYSAKYDLYMPYWNSIGGGYGIHELPEWANGYKEGESHLGTPVSHGCIRLGVGPAEFVYNWAPIGTPVYIHK